MTTPAIQYNCPHCIAEMSAAYSEVGEPVICPQCDEDLLVPLPGDRFAVVTGTILPATLQPATAGPCPHCRKRFQIPQELFGKHVRCTACRGEFSIETDGTPYNDQCSSRLEPLLEQLRQHPLSPNHVHAVVQAGELRDCRASEILCHYLFSIRRDRVRFLSAMDAWVRQRLSQEVLSHVDAWCDNYRATHDRWFLTLDLDPSFPMLAKEDFLADLEVAILEALDRIDDPRCRGALRRKLRSVIENRPHTAGDDDDPFRFQFENAQDQKVCELLVGMTGSDKAPR